MSNQIVWCDIPAVDLDRAIKFYSHVLAIEVAKDWPGMPVGVFKHGEGAVSCCVFTSDEVRPSDNGPLIYLNCAGRIEAAVTEVEKHGGKVLKPIHQIGPYGRRAVVLDSEGNRIALHSQ